MRVGNLAGRLAVFTDHGAVDVETVSAGRFGSDPQAIYQRWSELSDWAGGLTAEDARAFDSAALGCPVPRPAQVFAIGLNYAAHAAEAGLQAPESPAVFTKFATCLSGPEGRISLSSDTVDWEVELVVVIAEEARRVPADQAWRYVAGVTVGQDVSDRDLQLAGPAPQFSLGKSLPGYGPVGPYVVTPDELSDPDDLAIMCSINGDVVQEARTSDMIFSVPVIIERLSTRLTLLPGDVIFTGTPAGVGHSRQPRRYLAPGDELVSSIESVGTMCHRFDAP